MELNPFGGEILFTKEHLLTLSSIFEVKAAFQTALQPIQILDGVAENTTAFTVKTEDVPVIFNEYNTGANVAAGTGTGNTTRFGPADEVIYTDVDVPYDVPLASNSLIDRVTVNRGFEAAVAARQEKVAVAQVEKMNKKTGEYIGDRAGNVTSITAVNETNLINIFSAMRAFYVNSKVSGEKSAYVTPEVYSQLLVSGLMATDKNSRTNIDTGVVGDGKAFGFHIFEEPDDYFADDAIIYFVPHGVFLPFIGINLARTIDSSDHAGVYYQTLAKGGTYIGDEHAAVVSRVDLDA